VTFLLALIFALPPVPAAYFAAGILGRPDIAPALVGICHRESRCEPIGAHLRDHGRVPGDGWPGQVRLGHLRPWCQPYKPRTWATRGAWGMSAASAWPYLPPCYRPQWLDVPIVGALAAARRYVDRCDGRRNRQGWCHPGRKKPRSVTRAGFWGVPIFRPKSR